MKIMRVVAEFGGYKVICDINGGAYMCNGTGVREGASTYELIRSVKDAAIRSELAKQWAYDRVAQAHAEHNHKEAEYRG